MGITLKLKSELGDEIDLTGNDFILEGYRPTASDLSEVSGTIDEQQNISSIKYQTLKIKISLTIRANIESNKNAISVFFRKVVANTNNGLNQKYYFSYKEDSTSAERQTQIYSGKIIISDNYLKYEKFGGVMKMTINMTCASVWEATSATPVLVKDGDTSAPSSDFLLVDNSQNVTDGNKNFLEVDTTDCDYSFDSIPVIHFKNNVADTDLHKLVIYKKTKKINSGYMSDYDSSINLLAGEMNGTGGTIETLTDAKYLAGQAVRYTWTTDSTQKVFTKRLQESQNNNFVGETYKVFLAMTPSSKAVDKQTRFRLKYSGNAGQSSTTEWFYAENSNYQFSTILKIGQKGVSEHEFVITLEAQSVGGDTLILDYIEILPIEQILEINSFVDGLGINDGTANLIDRSVYKNIDSSLYKNSYYTLKGKLSITPDCKQRFYFVAYWLPETGDTLSSYKRAQYSILAKMEELKRYLV
ncbi:MAG: hypothetical protein KGZ97_09670 [Bacteroidetes bacterium]|nr:hypothetical protein [Bacteroidota bacterium]